MRTIAVLNNHPQKHGKHFSNLNILPFIKDKSAATEEVVIEEKPEMLYDSIRYSRWLQGNMMSKYHLLEEWFPESFLLDMPKHGVSGDFCWMAQVDDKIILAVGDCTGHGVPGALISVLGISILNQTVIGEKKTDPALILEQLDKAVTFSFQDTSSMSMLCHDGMDISLCCIDLAKKVLEFSGARRPVYIFPDNSGELSIYKGSRFSIGGHGLKGKSYQKQVYTYRPGDCLYLFTDGYVDQFGGPNNKKLLEKNFRNILNDIQPFRMNDQRKILKGVLKGWKEKNEQTDDILIMGLKL